MGIRQSADTPGEAMKFLVVLALSGLDSAYAAYNPYRAIPAFHYRGKREADAEADPQLPLDGRIQTFHLPQDVQTVYNTAIPQVQALTVQNLPVLTRRVVPGVQALPIQNLPVQTVFNTAIPEKVVYPQTPLLKTADHTVVATPAGYVHSSHVGLCTNNMGVAVP